MNPDLGAPGQQRPQAHPVAADTPTVELDLTETGVLERLFAAFHQLSPALRRNLQMANLAPPSSAAHKAAVQSLKTDARVQVALRPLLDAADCEDLREELGRYPESLDDDWVEEAGA